MLKQVRICAAAATVAAALALTGCSSESDGGGGGKKNRGGDSDNSSSAGSTGGGSEETPSADPDEGAQAGGINGLWVTKKSATEAVTLLVREGKMVAVAEAKAGDAAPKSCVGSATGQAGSQTFTLTCTNGGQRSKGTVESLKGSTLTVSWEGVGTDVFQKSSESELPEGMPTDLGGAPQR